MKIHWMLFIVSMVFLSCTAAFAGLEAERMSALEDRMQEQSDSVTVEELLSEMNRVDARLSADKSDGNRSASLEVFRGSTWYLECQILTWFYDRYDFADAITTDPEDGSKQIILFNQENELGLCTESTTYDYACIHGDAAGTILFDFYFFDLDGTVVSDGYHLSRYYDGTYSSIHGIRGGRIGGDCSVTPEDGAYYIPYVPKIPGFMLGFAFSNKRNNAPNSLTVTYYSNSGEELGTQSLSITAGGQTAAMASVQSALDGWAIVQASLPVDGMALVFGEGSEPMYDIDFASEAKNSLIVNHVAREGGWSTRAMLANPNPSPAQVTVVLHPKAGGSGSSEVFSIPAMGAVQYDLGRLGGEGTASFSSTQTLAGFELYDGRSTGHNWLGGLSLSGAQ